MTVSYVTANHRLATHHSRDYDQQQQALGLQSWHSLDCLPIGQWLDRLYRTLPIHDRLLSDVQALTLWTHLVTELADSASEALYGTDFLWLRPQAFAQLAYSAWQLLQQWCIPLAELAEAQTLETHIFYTLAQRYQHYCDRHQCRDHSARITQLADYLAQNPVNHCALPSRLVLIGFDDIPPQLQRILERLQPHCEIAHHNPTVSGLVHRSFFSGHREEITAMALWALSHWRQNPNQRIGCVVPQLEQWRSLLTQTFDHYWQQTVSDHPLNETSPFSLSGGEALDTYPLVATALALLSLSSASPVTLEQWGYLLRSAFLRGSASEFTARSRLEWQLRQQEQHALDINEVYRLTQRQGECPVWQHGLKMCLAHEADFGQSKTLLEWVFIFEQRLMDFGWPGERELNSAEYQQLQRWQKLLGEWIGLESVLPATLSFAEAIRYLQMVASQTLFQPKSGNTPIQILGVLEAAGLTFDRLWIMGMNEDTWPPSAHPNPLLPLELQRRYQLPHACAERELYYCRRLTTRFAHSAAECLFSYSLQEGDRPLRPSPLIVHQPLVALTELAPSARWPLTPVSLVTIEDTYGSAVARGEIIRGGASILKNQAACPFRAFAQHRLGALPIPILTVGLSPKARGIYLHAVMALIWQQLQTQDQLSRQDSKALETLVTACIQQVFMQKPPLISMALRELELQRMRTLIMNWLAIEQQRPPFRVVACESVHSVEFVGLFLELRIDRQDVLETGERIVIDYKTGEVNLAAWEGERPEDPQLPLYGLISDTPIDGLAFVEIHAGQVGIQGFSAHELGIAGMRVQEDWVEYQKQHLKVLTRLAQDFVAGYAKADPKNAQQTCRQCGLQALCRISVSRSG